MTFAASATFIDVALCIPFFSTLLYNSATFSNVSSSIPETIFVIFSNLCTLSPGLTLSGEYAILKSLPPCIPENFSNIGKHISSVNPGYTVDSYITIAPFDIFFPTISLALITGVKSGVLSSFTGVGTATIILLHSLNLVASVVKNIVVLFIASFPTSLVTSIPFLYSSIFFSLVSNPIVLYFFANSTASGIPTYPNPTTPTVISLIIFPPI